MVIDNLKALWYKGEPTRRSPQMPRLPLNFLPADNKEPTDEQLLLQLAYGLCRALQDPRR